MKYYLLDNPPGTNNKFNVGDDIQSLAAKRYLPKIDGWINKGRLSEYEGDTAKIISNGWFIHEPEYWPPSSDLLPLYISFHVNENVKNAMLNPIGMEHLRKYSPIGCRDFSTLNIMKENGIPAWFSGCLTLTLEREKYCTENTREGIYFVDVLYKMHSQKPDSLFGMVKHKIKKKDKSEVDRIRIIESIFSSSLLDNVQKITHSCAVGDNSREFRLMYADTVLRKYANAQLVVTSRIHCALPCLAFGTPVIFIDGGLNDKSERCRLDGLTDWFNTISITDNGEFSNNFDINTPISPNTPIQNKELHIEYANKLIEKCESFINNR
ncbi:polysaccharide pyruvyl transferase family protein [Methylobacter sp. Wu1]|uniref:polysaccharide pyruvyl transferase family protein n=1 Tax=Methylobacter sp. Wu1 TaxID=3119359 RepID=UPI002F94777D